MRILLPLLLAAAAAVAETPVETSNEARFQIDYKLPEAALAKFIQIGRAHV